MKLLGIPEAVFRRFPFKVHSLCAFLHITNMYLAHKIYFLYIVY
jgi:hypothetical protein